MSSSCVVEKMTCRHLEHANKSAAWDQMKKTMWWCMNFRSKCFSQHCSALLHISVKATDVLRGTFGRALSSWSSFADPGLERETESWQGETPHPLGDTRCSHAGSEMWSLMHVLGFSRGFFLRWACPEHLLRGESKRHQTQMPVSHHEAHLHTKECESVYLRFPNSVVFLQMWLTKGKHISAHCICHFKMKEGETWWSLSPTNCTSVLLGKISTQNLPEQE